MKCGNCGCEMDHIESEFGSRTWECWCCSEAEPPSLYDEDEYDEDEYNDSYDEDGGWYWFDENALYLPLEDEAAPDGYLPPPDDLNEIPF